MFEKSSRLKLRFESGKGQLTVEDLWDLPLADRATNLDDIARGLNKQLKSGDDVSFVHKAKKSDEIIQLKFDVVKHIIDVRLAENEARDIARENSQKKQRILSLIADKQDDELKGKSLEDLTKMVNELS